MNSKINWSVGNIQLIIALLLYEVDKLTNKKEFMLTTYCMLSNLLHKWEYEHHFLKDFMNTKNYHHLGPFIYWDGLSLFRCFHCICLLIYLFIHIFFTWISICLVYNLHKYKIILQWILKHSTARFFICQQKFYGINLCSKAEEILPFFLTSVNIPIIFSYMFSIFYLLSDLKFRVCYRHRYPGTGKLTTVLLRYCALVMYTSLLAKWHNHHNALCKPIFLQTA